MPTPASPPAEAPAEHGTAAAIDQADAERLGELLARLLLAAWLGRQAESTAEAVDQRGINRGVLAATT